MMRNPRRVGYHDPASEILRGAWARDNRDTQRRTFRRRSAMGAVDKAKNTVQSTKGRAEEAVGHSTKNRDLEAKGKVNRAAGSLKQAGEKVKDAVKK
jgi:uncharacterized protein YjbJ (UPF0337 family)